jgi:hypothetical protein
MHPFSGDEPLVDFSQLLAPLRNIYLIEYESQIVTSGNHTLELSLTTSLGEIQAMVEFYLDVQPPNPIFISPPREITRVLPETSEQTESEGVYQPDSITLDLLIEFPDNHPRDISELIFRVDEEIVEQRVTPPFDQVDWDLSLYKTSATHYLSIEVVDILGLSRISLNTPVVVNVEVPPPNLGNIIGNNALAFAGLFLIILFGLMLFILIARGNIQPSDSIRQEKLISRLRQVNGKSLVNKVIPGLFLSVEDPGNSAKKAAYPYRLIPINDISQQLFPEPIRVTKTEILLGNDPNENEISITHHSVAEKHAQIKLGRGKKYQISDFGSPAGTWIKYQQITSTKPQILEDGDIISIGKAGFRFQLIITKSPVSTNQEKNS